ncbi:Alpha/Beta hydrolase protein [Pseudoneurospora amorphoporcata]|uniref:Alpha/Beta hydrolase protein n=1 Tax=Pseudoneurospora amorphoporcata TaxID=241081 RepID=A0AAN6P1E9_9PEZI|nr:Alpha/Beta hydrolase protein [Pseudoneurospora amorphoporcata]
MEEFSFDKVDEDLMGFFYAPAGYIDYTFKSSSGVELGVRVWPAENVVQDAAPIAFWVHGGGFLGGHHFVPLPWLTPGFRKRGYHLVSLNYRLAPQAALDHQLADCIESVEWCRKILPSILGEGQVDVDRYVLVGESAGGTLVTLMGLHLTSPPPRAIVDVYGLVDIWHYVNMPDRTPGPWKGEFTDEELERFISDRDLNNVLTDACCWNEQELLPQEELRKRWAADIKYDKRFRLQAEAHQWRSTRAFPGDVHKAFLHSERFPDKVELDKFITSMAPLKVLQEDKQRSYPPTAFLHGSADEPVPIQQSYDLAASLKERGVPVIERCEEGEPHVFDIKYTSTIQPVLDFVDQHVGIKRQEDGT